MERYNRQGAPVQPGPLPLEVLMVSDIVRLQHDGCQIIDIRGPAGFAGGHIPGSLSLWRGGISSFAGWFLNYEDPVIIIDDENQNPEQVICQLFRMGYDTKAGILTVGIASWYKSAGAIGTIGACSVQELRDRLETSTPFLLDVRDIRNRHAAGHIGNSRHIYVGELHEHLSEIPKNEDIFVYCDAGYKGSLAASVLARHNYQNVTNVLGGMTAWKQVGFPIEH